MTTLTETGRAVLVAVRSRLASPSAWTQGLSARDAAGSGVNQYSRRATCWCLHAALMVESARLKTMVSEPYQAIHDIIGEEPIIEWNDHPRRTHDDVLKVLDDAIAGEVSQ